MRYLLSTIYGAVVSLRAFLYVKGLYKSRKLPYPAISVGNLTLGGTGKTPFVAFLAKLLKDSGYQPVILSRGYKGKAESSNLLVSNGQIILCDVEECGDEPYWLARELKGVPLVVGKNRYKSAQLVQNQFKTLIFILDDGYQHLQLKRDLNILLLDATDPFGGYEVVPSGRLREPLKALARADLIAVTRSHVAFDQDEIELNVRKRNRTAPVWYFYHDAVAITDVRSGTRFLPRDFMGKRVIAVAGIANPESFLRDLGHYQIKVMDRFIFRDHHAFTQMEIDEVLNRLAPSGAEAVLTTEKDAVRLERLNFAGGKIFSLRIEMRAEDPEEYRKYLLDEVEFILARAET